jgi:hypothetical protein
MIKHAFSTSALLTLLALPLAAHAQPAGVTASPSAPATTAAPVAAPEAARTDPAAQPAKAMMEPRAAAAGTAMSFAEQRGKIQKFVVAEKKPSAKLADKVAVGAVLPSSIELYALPADIIGKSELRYTIVNDRAVLVEARTRKVTEFIN